MPRNPTTRRANATTRLATRLGAALVAAAAAIAAPPAAAQNPGETVVWGQDVFVIPYKWSGGGDRSSIREVALYLSDNQGADWNEVTRARPDVQSFMYRAPGDGEYWFAIRTIDATGDKWPAGPMRPELRVVVDTQLPTVQITRASIAADGRLSVEATASDPQLEPSTAAVSFQHPATGGWQNASVTTTPGVGGVVAVRASAVLPPGTSRVMVRVLVKDKAGNPASAGVLAISPHEASRRTPAFSASAQLGAALSPAAQSPAGAPVDPFTSSTAFVPLASPLANTSSSERHDRWQAAPPPAAQVWRPDNTPLPSVAAAAPDSAAPQEAPQQTFRYASSAPPQELPPAGAGAGPQRLMVNSDRFELQYDLQSVGRWGVSKVEVWGTEDRGASWRRFAIDADQRSPVDVQAPADGLYGFAILVQSVGGLERLPPRAGDRPDIYVEVDRSRPEATITSASQPDGYFADHLQIAWQAGDSNLADRPISLLYAAQPSGPWMPIASNLPNNGRYSWRLQRHLPDRLYVRLEARDLAGNVGVDQTAGPVEIRLPESSGRIRHARPLQ